MKNSKGITLLALAVTITILIILAGISIEVFKSGGMIDRAEKTRFEYSIRVLEQSSGVFSTNAYWAEKSNEEAIPNRGKLTDEEKNIIVQKIPTLSESVYIATGETVYDRNLYWLKHEEILEERNNKKRYLIDMDTLQVYQYEGTHFFERQWHTLEFGIPDDSAGGSGADEGIPEGWMRIHLYYPENSVNRQWRIGRPGESRTNGELIWQDYTGEPILVKIDDIKNIWIRYELNGVEEVVPPKGKLAVDIRIAPTTPNVESVTVSIYFDKDSTNRKYKVGNSGWTEYKEPFVITENCTIEAMAQKEIPVTDNNGNTLGTTTIKGKDSLTISNIGEAPKNETLPAPTITQITAKTGEIARAQVNYPTDQGDIIKVYKINKGTENTYIGDIGITEWGTEITAYYYKEGKKSPEVRKTFNDPTKLEVEILVQPNPSVDESIKTTIVEIVYSEEAENKTYKINDGAEQNYTQPFIVTEDCSVTAYAKKTGIETAKDTTKISFKKKQSDWQNKITAPIISQSVNSDYTEATITITYDSKAVKKQYSKNGAELQNYTSTFKAVNGDIIYAVNEDETGNIADTTHKVTIKKPGEQQIKLNKPTFTQTVNSDYTSATVTITYDSRTTTKQYQVNGGTVTNYTAPISNLANGDKIKAFCSDGNGNSTEAEYTVSFTKPEEPGPVIQLAKPTFSQEVNSDYTQATVTITYDSKATTKQYQVNGGALTDYTVPISNLINGDKIKAICSDEKGNSIDAEYTVSFTKPDEPEPEPVIELAKPTINVEYLNNKEKASITIIFDSNADVKQYSIDGGELQTYNGSFEVTKNGTVIRAINSKGEKSEEATKTIQGLVTPLTVTIAANPDTDAETEKVTVTISYDERATSKTYRINGGAEQSYTDAFEVTQNCTIVAEAKATDSYGKSTKQITNLPTGVAAPTFVETKTKTATGENAIITINYDKKSVSNTYKINGGESKGYNAPFEVTENGTIITAYSADKFGNTAVSQYVVNDLEKYLIIEKDKYYWIKLPYPEQSINREYKYKSTGIWKDYPEDGFILVKSEYEQELIKDDKIVKLEVETGKYVDFTGHWYILDSDPQKLSEDIYMRWDDPNNGETPTRVPLQIIALPAPPETTDKVDVFIVYPSTAIKKQYKINDGEYQDYVGQLAITKNNTTITAKTQYADGTWSDEISYTVTNIVEASVPEGIIDITATPTAYTTGNVTATITYQTNDATLKKKYKLGNGAWQYLDNEVASRSQSKVVTRANDNTFTKVLTITENTTIYAALENSAGKSSDAITYNVENIDRTPPIIKNITVTECLDTSVTIKVNAIDEVSKIVRYEYKIGTGSYVSSTSNQYKYDGLTKGTSYEITVQVTDSVGHTASKTINIIPGSYLIANVDDLINVKNDLAGKYMVIADIDLSGIEWTPIHYFRGKIAGMGHTIDNLTVRSESSLSNGTHAGLFGDIGASGVVIRDLKLTNVDINTKANYVSALVTRVAPSYSITVTNVQVDGNIVVNEGITTKSAGGVWLGGIVADTSNANITNASSSCNIYANGSGIRVGGIVGEGGRDIITNCHSTGNIQIESDETSNSLQYVGGLIGYESGKTAGTKGYPSKIKNCYSTGIIEVDAKEVNSYIGGLVGYSTGCETRSSYSAVDIITMASKGTERVGGLTGYDSGLRSESSASLTEARSIMDKCYATGNITVNSTATNLYAGGLVAQASSMVSNCFSTGTINAKNSSSTTSRVGGLIGRYWGYNDTSYNHTSRVTASTNYTRSKINGTFKYVGPLIGNTNSYATISKCYYITGVSGVASNSKGTAISSLTTAKQQSPYTNFTFDATHWSIKPGQTTPYITELPIPDSVY